MNDREQDEERDRRETETFRRVHQLIKRGYRIDWTVRDVEDAFWLEHPGGGVPLILYPDGKIVSLDKSTPLNPAQKEDQDRICNDTKSEGQLFDRWLRSVRVPSWRERTAADREKYIWQPGCLVLFFLICLGVGKVIEIVWNAVAKA